MSQIMNYILEFDWFLLNFFHNIANPVFDFIAPIITLLGEDGIAMILLAVILIIPKKTRKLGLALILTIALSGIFCNALIKPLIARPRAFWFNHLKDGISYTSPFNTEQWKVVKGYTFLDIFRKPDKFLIPWKYVGDFCFPSGHTSVTFCVAYVIYKMTDKKYGITALVLACLVGISRLYLMVHYPSDVIGGVCSGLLCGIFAVLIMDLVYPRLQNKFGRLFPEYKLKSEINPEPAGESKDEKAEEKEVAIK